MFEIVEIPTGAAESTEQLGTKYKFWYSDSVRGITLFKEGRPGTGENWAEKIACELAGLLDMPHATYDFARYEDRFGVVSATIVSRGARLIHGNELLQSVVIGYGENRAKRYGPTEHTLRRVMSYFRAASDLLGTPIAFEQTDDLSSAMDVFIGYLMFDAWIANQDRHDENWGVLRNLLGNSFLAPSYDHGSSMGRNESDEKRLMMLTTRDRGQHIEHYVTNARSAFYPHLNSSYVGRVKPLSTLDTFVGAASYGAEAAKVWLERLGSIDQNAIQRILDNIPADLMTDTSKDFTLQLLRINRKRVLDCGI